MADVELTDEDREELIAAAELHLSRKGCSGWGKHYTISEPARRRVAAEWLIDELVGILIAVDELDGSDS